MTSTTTLSLTWLHKVLCLAGCAIFFLLAYAANGLMHRSEVEDELDQAVRAVDRESPGWRLTDLEAARAAVPDDENAALDVDRAARLLPEEWFSWDQRRMVFFHSRSPYALDDVERQFFQSELAQHKDALDEARPLADKPRGRYTLAVRDQPWKAPLNHVTRVSLVVYLLTLDAIYRADADDQDAALRSCRGAINAARALGDEPFVFSQLTRKGQAALIVRGVQHLLNHGVRKPERLADLQDMLQAEADHPGFLIAMRGYRAILHASLEAVESGQVAWDQMFGERPRSSLLNWHTAPSRDELRHQHAEVLPFLARTIEVAGKPSPERAKLLRDMQSDLEDGEFPLLVPVLRGLPAIEERFAARDAQLLCAVAAVACERYRRDHRRWPDSLGDLTPDYLKETPLDPADGQPLRYQRLDDNIVISSQCTDDRGRRYAAADPLARYGVMMRLWDVSQRRRPRPPVPPDVPMPMFRRPPP